MLFALGNAMPIFPFFRSPWLQDLVAMFVTFAVALTWLRINDFLAQRRLLSRDSSTRKSRVIITARERSFGIVISISIDTTTLRQHTPGFVMADTDAARR